MIKYIKGNLLNITNGIIMHGCNMQAVMGSGVALAIKQKYPENFEVYKQALKTQTVKLGDIVWYTPNADFSIANALTQQFYGRAGLQYVDYNAVQSCFEAAVKAAIASNKRLYFPMLGGWSRWRGLECY